MILKLLKSTGLIVAVCMAAIFCGCSTTEPPQYQGKSGTSPTVEDYYPSKTNQTATKLSNDHDHTQAKSSIKVPDRAAAIFAETEKELRALSAAIRSKDQRAVHRHDVAVRELIGRIPQRATPEIKPHVDDHVREIADASKSAHAAAHDEDWTKAESDVKRAQESLKHLQSHFKEIPH